MADVVRLPLAWIRRPVRDLDAVPPLPGDRVDRRLIPHYDAQRRRRYPPEIGEALRQAHLDRYRTAIVAALRFRVAAASNRQEAPEA